MFIGIDLGTSSVKMILADNKQNIIATSSSPLTVQNPKDGYSEQNPKEWIGATIKCLEDLKSKKRKEFSETISIGISGHMHGATITDNSGSVIRPCILWNDTRSHKECIEFENQSHDVRAISGNITMPGFTAPKINWLKKNEKDNFNKIYKILLPKDYLRFYLTGEYYSEMSDASGTLWLDVRKRKWSDELLSCSFLEKKQTSLIVNESNKNDIRKILGNPSTTSKFDNDVWIYIERKQTQSNLKNLGRMKIYKNDVLILEIDKYGVLKKKDFYNKDDMQNIKIVEATTEAGFRKNSFLYDLMSSMRQKINDPLGQRAKKRKEISQR